MVDDSTSFDSGPSRLGKTTALKDELKDEAEDLDLKYLNRDITVLSLI